MARRKGSRTLNIVGSGVAYKYAKKSLDKNKYGLREFIGPRIKWTVALNAINFEELRFRRYAFKYFSVKNPPLLEDKKDDVSRRGHSYEEVLKVLTDSGLKMEQWLNDLSLGNKIESIYEYLNTQYNKAIIDETKIYDKFIVPRLNNIGVLTEDIISNDGAYRNMLYEDFVDNTPVGEKINLHLNSKQLNYNYSLMTTIELWTRAAMNLLIPYTKGTYGAMSEFQKNELAFYSFIKSKELYDALKMDKRLSFFSRHHALGKDYAEDITDKINEDSLLILQKSLNDYFKYKGAPYLYLRRDINKIFETYIGGKYTSSSRKLKNTKIDTSAEQASKYIRENISELLGKYIKNGFIDEAYSEIQLSNKDELFFLVYADGYKPKSVLYEAKLDHFINHLNMSESEFVEKMRYPNKENKKLAKDFIETMYNVILDAIKKIETNLLHLLGLGILKIPEDISVFRSRAITYGINLFSDKKTEGILSSKTIMTSLYKSFNASNNNTFISGLLGEIGALDIKNIFYGQNVKGLITGSDFGGKSSFGLSVNDLLYKNGDYSLGVNVKHYVDSSNGTMTLYPEGKISSSNDTISKYLEPEEKEILRFITANSGLFNKTTIEREGFVMAYQHIPEFYRFQDRARGTLTNVFFELNNVIYPLSYIYANALYLLEQIIERLKHTRAKLSELRKNGLFDIELKNYKANLYQYHDVHEAFQEWEDDDFRLSTRKFPRGETTVNIKTKGLKINLMSLKLFN